MEYGLIGKTLSHSFSPELHGLLAEYDYRLQELEPEQVGPFLQKRAFRGINVTLPYKQTVVPYLDELDRRARAVGAVNTVVNRNGRLVGYNTDYDGMTALIRRTGLELGGKTVLILGTGGTSRTALAVAKDLGAAAVWRVSRGRREEGVISYEEAVRLPAEIILNTTPCGMAPHIDEQPIDLTRFGWLEGVIDAIYHPLRTRLVMQAREQGARGQGGLYMLVAQAAAAAELFLDGPLEDRAVEKAYRRIHGQKQNIVLIGMPGSGKSTVGALLADRLGRPVLDTDEMIIRAAGKPIAQIFEELGEEGFRELEQSAVAQAAKATGAIIATGGGVILRTENLHRLRQNGRIYFLDRPLEQLAPTADRPLSQTEEAMRQRFEERYLRYIAACDARIRAGDTAEAAADQIGEDFYL